MNTRKKEDVLKLAKVTSVELLEEKKSLHEILLSCKTICKYLGVIEKNSWIDLELNGYLGKYKTQEDLQNNLPSYRRTNWSFYDLYGNLVPLPHDILELFGKSVIYQPVSEIENSKHIIIKGQLLQRFNQFITKHGVGYASKKMTIHEGRIPNSDLRKVLEGIKNRTHEFLDNLISILE